MDVKNTHSVTQTEISVFGRQALDAERRRSPSLAGKVIISTKHLGHVITDDLNGGGDDIDRQENGIYGKCNYLILKFS